MIVSISSSIATFKTVTFQAGLNVLLADTRPSAKDTETRNSTGKTSLVEIIHFLLGSNCDKDSLFRIAELVEHTFTGVFAIQGSQFEVMRSGKDPAKIFILRGGEDDKRLTRRVDKESGRAFVSNVNWRIFLGHAMFGLPLIAGSSAFDESGAPTFRAMFAYFARRRNNGGFIQPEQQSKQQQRGDWQVNLSYLLGLDWEIPLEFQKVRGRERTLEELKKAAQGQVLGQVIGTVAELRPQVTIAETKAHKLREQLSNFEVLDSYRDLSQRAARAKTGMQAAGREAVSLQETIQHLEQALAVETPPERTDLQQMYDAVGVELPGVALRRFEEVNRFYSSVIENRRAHLQQEIADARGRITDGERRMARLDVERRDLLKTLEGRGALDDFLKLQTELANLDASAASLRERFKAAEILEGESTQLEIDRVNLKRRLQEDHKARDATLNQAILIIADTITTLYGDRSGRFVVEASENGPEFRISIEGDRSGGISLMEVFCFDLTLFRIVSARLGGPGFLLHDSHLFDGVDERQVAIALQLGQRAAGTTSQYIVTMNSDIFDRLPLPDDVDPKKVVLSTRLSDETETGGLFGFRFE
ncbi:ABC-three component system protein [Bradyrhizobium sp.]